MWTKISPLKPDQLAQATYLLGVEFEQKLKKCKTKKTLKSHYHLNLFNPNSQYHCIKRLWNSMSVLLNLKSAVENWTFTDGHTGKEKHLQHYHKYALFHLTKKLPFNVLDFQKVLHAPQKQNAWKVIATCYL